MGPLKVLTVLIAVFRFLRAAELCLVGDFDAQFSYVLQNAMLSDEQVAKLSEVCQDMEIILNTRWPGTVTTPFGSLMTGLALKASDVDCLATVPRLNASDSDRQLVIQTTKLFLRQPALYQQLHPSITWKVPIITFFYTPVQVYCDLSFKGPTGVENSKLVNYYMLLDDRVRPVTAFLKYWSQLHEITGSPMLPSYGLGLMAIFYFQQKGIVPSIFSLQQDAEPRFVNEWNNAFDPLPHENTNTDSVYELLRGFFEYYREFNFDDYIVSAYVGRPIAKSLFEDVDTVPEEFVLYKHLVRKGTIEPAMFSDMWIQDSFVHNGNLAKGRDSRLLSRLRSHVQYAAEKFAELPRDEVLRAILVKRESYDTPKMKRIITVDRVSEHGDCASA